MNSDLKYLLTPLPEDIAKLKGCGDFTRALRVIDKRLEKELPNSLKKRLELERYIIKDIPASYPYDFNAALEKCQNAFQSFTAEELTELWEMDAAEWYYIDGKVHFKEDIIANLVKTRPHLAARVKDPVFKKDKEGNFSMLDEIIAKMKSSGELACRIRIKARLKLKKPAERAGEMLRVHMPLPVEYAQVKDFKLLSTSHEPVLVNASDYPQRTVFFETPCVPGETFFVEYEYTNHVKYVEPKSEAVLEAQPSFYTEELEPHIVFTPYIKNITREIVGGESNPLARARKIYDFVTTRVMYSFVRPYFTITNIPEYAATGLKGDCGIQALLFITLCRCAGVPARWQAGLYANPLSIGHHDWAQFYVAPYGWLFADCSFGGAAWREGATERWNFYFGNLEPFRMPAASEFQFDFNPPMKFLRHDPYDNQGGEAEYAHMRLESGDFETSQEVVSLTEL